MTKIEYGLSTAEAEESIKVNGSNKLSSKKKTSFLSMLIDAFKDKWIAILVAALCLKCLLTFAGSLIPGVGDQGWYDAISILAAILLSTGFSAVSSYKNEKKFNALQEEASKTDAKVFRNGKLTSISADLLAVGDDVLLQTGDKVPADGFIINGTISVIQSALNGESDEAVKVVGKEFSNDVYNNCSVFRESAVASGEAIMHIAAVGDKTLLGSINESLQEEKIKSPSKERLEKLASSIGILGYTGGAAAAIINIIIGFMALSNADMLSFGPIAMLLAESAMFGVSIIIMAVPEGLPLMLALVSSMNASKLLSRNVLVRDSDAIETAGCIDILFSDKTGTITEGKLSVSSIADGGCNIVENDADNNWLYEMSLCFGLNNASSIDNGKAIGGNSTDRALLQWLDNKDLINFDSESISSKEQFNSTTKRASIMLDSGIIYIKGAPEALIKECSHVLLFDGSEKEMNDEFLKNSESFMHSQSERAMRLLAGVKVDGDKKILISIVCIRDEVREDAEEAIKTLEKAGVQTVIVTGDREDTAAAIAKEAGIDTSDDKALITHQELECMSDEELSNSITKLKVISRALPSDKRRLVKCAQSKHLACGMVGDGVNDASAIRSADVGFSVGEGAEAAKEASDIVILDGSLKSIEQSVLFGRTMSKSVKKFIIFQLTVNISTIILAIIAPLLGWSEPFTIVQVLWINLIMDTLAAIAFGEEPPLERYMNEKPASRSQPLVSTYMKASIAVSSCFISIVCLLILCNAFNVQATIGLLQGVEIASDGELRTFMFATFIYAVIANSLNARSTNVNVFEGITENKKFIVVMTSIAIMQTAILEVGGEIFGTTPLSIPCLALAFVLGLTIIPIDMIKKTFMSKRNEELLKL